MLWYPRENYLKKIRDFYHEADIVKVITGVRRCGKSCLMETIANELRESGVRKENIIYFNLDSQNYNKITSADQLENLISNSNHNNSLKYLFIDEIQNIEKFELVLNGFRGTGEWSIFITGSNSKLNWVANLTALNIRKTSSFKRILGLPTMRIILLSKSSSIPTDAGAPKKVL